MLGLGAWLTIAPIGGAEAAAHESPQEPLYVQYYTDEAVFERLGFKIQLITQLPVSAVQADKADEEALAEKVRRLHHRIQARHESLLEEKKITLQEYQRLTNLEGRLYEEYSSREAIRRNNYVFNALKFVRDNHTPSKVWGYARIGQEEYLLMFEKGGGGPQWKIPLPASSAVLSPEAKAALTHLVLGYIKEKPVPLRVDIHTVRKAPTVSVRQLLDNEKAYGWPLFGTSPDAQEQELREQYGQIFLDHVRAQIR